MVTRPLLGTHVSVSGGLATAFERGTRVGCTTMQLFTRNSNRWKGKPLTAETVASYKTAAGNASISPVFSHASYLINLCASSAWTLRRSRAAMEDELRRAETLGIRGVIVHPGSHLGAGEEEAVERIAASLNAVHGLTAGYRALTVLETTAGQGTAMGHRFEQLRAIIDRMDAPDRVAVCVDTCHLFAAGYPVHTEQGWEVTMVALDRIIGLGRLAAVHVNDARRGLGSRVDRHEHIGKGEIGLTCFRMLMNDPRLADVPKILETDKSEDMHEDLENMAVLRSLIADPADRGSAGAR